MKASWKADWNRVAGVVSSQAIFGAKFPGGEMRQDIESAFGRAGLSLLPQKHSDLKTNCSCPDWSNPCKHIAAVYYLLGEEFDRDPFLIFRLRGLEREELFEHLNALTGAAGALASERNPDAEPPIPSHPVPPPPKI